MQKVIAKIHWRDGWDWKDRLFFGGLWLIAVLGILALALRGLTLPDWKPEVWSAIASWVQAIGSIGVIVAGFMTVRYQLRAQRQEADGRMKAQERLRLSRSLQMLLASGLHGVVVLRSIRKTLLRPVPKWGRVATQLDELADSLARITADEFPTPGVAVSLKSLQIVIESNLQLAREVLDHGGNPAEPKAHCLNEVQTLITAFESFDARLVRELDKVANDEERLDLRDALKVIGRIEA